MRQSGSARSFLPESIRDNRLSFDAYNMKRFTAAGTPARFGFIPVAKAIIIADDGYDL